MAEKLDLNVQCYVKRNAETYFAPGNDPQLLYVSNVRPCTNPHPRIMHAHEHHVEVILVYSGESDFLLHNKKKHIKAGDLIVYNANIVHDEPTTGDSNTGWFCVAVGDLKMPGLRDNALIPDDIGYVFQTNEHFGAMRSLCEMMFHSLVEDEFGAETFGRSLLHAFLTKALLVVSQNQGAEEIDIEEENILGDRIKNYIDQHYAEEVTLQTISESLNASPYYLSHVFKRMSGYSPIQYLLRRRLGEAQTLLISTDKTIAEISGMVGFDTQNYFSAQFTKHVGMSPKKYRDNYIV